VAVGDTAVAAFFGLYDQIQLQPDDFFINVLNFLDVRADRKYLDEESTYQAVNTTDTSRIPPRVREYLEQKLEGEICFAKKLMGEVK